MDIKLKNNNGRTASCFISSLIFVLSSAGAYLLGLGILFGYQMSGNQYDDFSAEPTVIDLEMLIPNLNDLWIILISAIGLAIISLIISLMMCGRIEPNGKVHLTWFDKIFTDIQIAAAILAGVGLFGVGAVHYDVIIRAYAKQDALSGVLDEIMNWYYASTFEPYWLEVFFVIASTIALAAFELLIVQAIVKKLKNREFWKHTLIGTVVYYLLEAANKNEDVFWKVMITAILACLVSATWVGTILVLILIFIYVPKWLKKYQAVKEGVSEVKNGHIDYKIPVDGNGELDKLAMNINEISESTSRAVQNELKNQRLKTDLISNVSHDLKTPLTSMVSYIDLLKTEGLDSENAPEYVDIIDQKTQRLKKLTEDLFEAAKASSGAIPVNMEKIEMNSIVNQALGELDERLADNNLDVIFSKKTDMTFVMADGQLLWRVIENLLVNASKYALPGSRVYVDISERGGDNIILEVKNMSKEPLNISADELMERFKRGDESRNTEGSGLGLAIAKDLTRLMNGLFDITIDGDLFKATVCLVKAE